MQETPFCPDPMDPNTMISLKHWGTPLSSLSKTMPKNVIIPCGWGRLLFGQTFTNIEQLAMELLQEQEGRRDLAFYLRDPHVVLSYAPQSLFIDPSLSFRLAFQIYKPLSHPLPELTVRLLNSPGDIECLNRIYDARHMVTVDNDFFADVANNPAITVLVAVECASGMVVGGVTGIDHRLAFNDPDNGSSLWALAVDPQTSLPGVGEALVRAMVETFQRAGRNFLDLSVMHDNQQAIALYEKLGFQQVPIYCLKKKNPINEKLFLGPHLESHLNIYARIIVNEARRRGIQVEVLDEENGYFRLTLGGRSIVCRESLSELTSAIAMSRCSDKRLTLRFLRQAGLSVPEQTEADSWERVEAFMKQYPRVVVKPVQGEQGQGVFVNLTHPDEVRRAIEEAEKFSQQVIVETFIPGEDVRIIVIGDEAVAAAVRKPAQILGDGKHTIGTLIEKQSRRRAAATAGESRIPLDAETLRCVRKAGFTLKSILPAGQPLSVRRTANLHTGGTIHDVTDIMNPALMEAAVIGARALNIPVVGFDFIVPDIMGQEYVIIEANERPGLANHEPQPTVQRFIDLLFPDTRVGWYNQGGAS
ncbi:MAG: N-acetylglutaminylglutamine synthetase [Magnetococcus sp. DMHC-6]